MTVRMWQLNVRELLLYQDQWYEGKIRKFADKMQEKNICLYVCILDNAIRPTRTFCNIVQRVLNTDIFIHLATV